MTYLGDADFPLAFPWKHSASSILDESNDKVTSNPHVERSPVSRNSQNLPRNGPRDER